MAYQKKSIDLDIFGTKMTVKIDENEEHVREVADYVDRELTEIAENNRNINRVQLMLVGCMNIADDLFAAKDQAEAYKNKLAQMKRQNDVSDGILAEEKEKTKRAEKESQDIRDQLDDMRQEIDEKNDLLNQYREQLKTVKEESESNRKSILNLQNKLFESQIELSKSKEQE